MKFLLSGARSSTFGHSEDALMESHSNGDIDKQQDNQLAKIRKLVQQKLNDQEILELVMDLTIYLAIK